MAASRSKYEICLNRKPGFGESKDENSLCEIAMRITLAPWHGHDWKGMTGSDCRQNVG